ncbi:MAG: recombinase family protein [Terriglobales bacterium]
MTAETIPAAQYLRMSTDHQQYSLDNQADAIARYAEDRGFSIVKTYCDAAKSGLRLKNRLGLRQLLKDVVEGNRTFRAVLVYDVSRWGRFQDADEAAHYEFLCKSAGVPVHYCAETFANDNSIPAFIMKALKRTMAGEYSRDLSTRVRAGLVRLAKQGYKLGGNPPYGLRRMLLDSKGQPKQPLAHGERKCIANERVILVPGPAEEIATVRRIFHEFANEHRSLRSIAIRLNRDGIPFLSSAQWNANTVSRILKQTNYVGSQVWGRTTAFLAGPVKKLPPQEWVICHNAFEPIIDMELFDSAQITFANLTCHLSDEEFIERLRKLLKTRGRLTSEIIQESRSCPGLTTYYKRLGGLLNAYQRLGYLRPDLIAEATSRQRTMLLRRELIKSLVDHFSGQLQEVRPNRRFRALLRYRRTGLLISVVLARCYPAKIGRMRWLVEAPKNERRRVTLVALLNEGNTAIVGLRVFRRMNIPGPDIRVREGCKWLQAGIPLERASDLLTAIRQVRMSGEFTDGR